MIWMGTALVVVGFALVWVSSHPDPIKPHRRRPF